MVSQQFALIIDLSPNNLESQQYRCSFKQEGDK